MKKFFSLILLLAFTLFAGNTYLNNANSSVNQSYKLRDGERQFLYNPSSALQMVTGDTLWIIKANTTTRAGYNYDGIDVKEGADSISTWLKIGGHEEDTVQMLFIVQHADNPTSDDWLNYTATDTIVVDSASVAANTLYEQRDYYIPGSYWRAMLVILDATDTVDIVSIRRYPIY